MRKLVIYIILNLLSVAAFAQVNNGFLTSLTAIAGIRERFPVEKLYLQLDKPYYTVGDTMRFKAYLMNADFLKPSLKSALLYLELDNANNKPVKQMMVPLVQGLSWGGMAIVDKEVPEGSYTLRAYTNWMRNFGDDYIYQKNIYISPVNGGSTLIKTQFKLDSVGGKPKIQAALKFTKWNTDPLRLKDMQLRVMNGKHTLFKNKVSTGMDGTMQLNFDVTDKSSIKNLSIQAQQIGKGADTATLTIPVIIKKTENTDVQFMPEGGILITGISTKVGFKAISEDGKGVQISGRIINSKQQEIATFRSAYKGMGHFEFTPQAGESYVAKVVLPGNITKTYPLPSVKSTGTTLKIEDKNKEALELSISAAPELLNSSNTYYLIAQTRGLICYTAPVNFNGAPVKKTILKNLFPTGVAHFTLLNSANQPLNERIIFIDHQDNLHVSVTTDKGNYTIRDSIAVAIAVKNAAGKPVRGTFSLAVTDDDQVSTDSTGNNIISNLLLTSDLKGTIEEPGYYFENRSPERLAALDNLLLTQGWIGYNWKDVFNPVQRQPQYAFEPAFVVQGTLTNIFNKPITNTVVTLLQRQPLLTMYTQTDNKGHFLFKGKELFPLDTAFYLVETKSRTSNVGINVDEFVPPVFAAPKERLFPWYINSDSTLLHNAGTKMAQLQAEADYKGEGHMLKEVVIKEKKIIPDSYNLNGPGEADIIIDEKEISAAKKMSLYEFLQHKFKNFYRDPIIGNHPPAYHLNQHTVVFVIDGVFVGRLGLPVDLYMDDLTAEDIKGIEVMSSAKYAIAYDPEFIHKEVTLPDRRVPVYLELTTYSGHGGFLKRFPGRYVYKPLPFSLPKEFYRPRYTDKNATMAMGTDLRSTIHWAPQVITDGDGRATVSFFSADKPANYTLILEGTDLNGNFGYSRQKIKITSKPR